jgi:hypothetical protein
MRLPLVSSARGGIAEPSSAQIALVRFSAGVDIAVGLQARELSESLPAVNANMWLLSGVQLLVAFEISLALERFVTSFAHPLSRHGGDFQ